MELKLSLADDMQRVVKEERAVTWYVSEEISKSDWVEKHCLLLAQALAIGFYSLNNVIL